MALQIMMQSAHEPDQPQMAPAKLGRMDEVPNQHCTSVATTAVQTSDGRSFGPYYGPSTYYVAYCACVEPPLVSQEYSRVIVASGQE